MRVTQVMDACSLVTVPISARAQSRDSREHSAKMWRVVRPISYESYAALVNHICMFLSATADLFMLIHSLPLVHRPEGVLLVF